jgi:hypothetical protein
MIHVTTPRRDDERKKNKNNKKCHLNTKILNGIAWNLN